jgi:phosphoribosyl-dephospho-CoA transferase
LECRDPPGLAARRDWRGHARCTQVPALAALSAVESIMECAGLAGRWGPGGSVGFELASGAASATSSSDLDLILAAPEPWSTQAAAALHAALHAALTPLSVRADVLIETPRGALSLAEYARARPPYLLRTAIGPLLGAAPWPHSSAA